jgi:hypothetical protein
MFVDGGEAPRWCSGLEIEVAAALLSLGANGFVKEVTD